MFPITLLAFAAGPPIGFLPPGAIARLGEFNWDYRTGVASAAFSRDGSCVLATCFTGKDGGSWLFVWDTKSGRLAHTPPRPDEAWSGAIVPHPRNGVALWVKYGKLALWDIKGRKAAWELSTEARNVAWGQGGRWFVELADDQDVVLRHGRTGKALNALGGQAEAHRWVAASPVRREVAVFQNDGTLFVYDPFTRKQRWKARCFTPGDFHSGIGMCAFCPRGEWVLTGCEDEPVRMWRARDGKPGRVLVKGPSGCCTAAFAPSGLVAVGKEFGQVRIIDPIAGKELRRWRTVAGLRGLAYSPDGRTLATWHKRCPRVLLWDSRTGKLLNPDVGRDELLQGVEYVGEGKLVTRGWSGQRRMWDTATGKTTPLPLRPLPMWGQAWSRDMRFRAERARPGLTLHDTTTGKRLLLLKGEKGLTSPPRFSPDGGWLVACLVDEESASDVSGKAVVWDTATGKPRLAGKGVVTWEFAPDGKRLLVLVEDVGLRMIDLKGGEREFFRLDADFVFEVHSIRWSADGRLVVVSCQDKMFVLDGQAGKVLRAFKAGGLLSELVLAVSPDNRLMAAYEENGYFGDDPLTGEEIQVYSLETGQRLHTFKGHAGAITGLAFSPRGDTLASCSGDGTVLLWDLTGRRRRHCHLSDSSFAARWNKLAGADAALAEKAFWEIVCCPDAPALLRKAVPPQRGIPADRLNGIVSGLGSDDFETRSKAEAALLAHGPGAAPALRNLARTASSLEVRLRGERVLRRWASAPEASRLTWAVLALEKAGTPGAKALLKDLAGGEPGAPLTEDAKAALKRLRK